MRVVHYLLFLVLFGMSAELFAINRTPVTLAAQVFRHHSEEVLKKEKEYLAQANQGNLFYLTEGLRADDSPYILKLFLEFYKLKLSHKAHIYGLEYRDSELIVALFAIRETLLKFQDIGDEVDRQHIAYLFFTNWLICSGREASEIWKYVVKNKQTLFARDTFRPYFERRRGRELSDGEYEVIRGEILGYLDNLEIHCKQLRESKEWHLSAEIARSILANRDHSTELMMAVLYELTAHTVQFATTNQDYIQRAHPPREVSLMASDFFTGLYTNVILQKVAVDWRDDFFAPLIVERAKAARALNPDLPVTALFGEGHLPGVERRIRERLDPSEFEILRTELH
jgi:hypothetical protein